MTERIICECGFAVTGTSELHAKANLENHKKGKFHKILMEEKRKLMGEQNNLNKGLKNEPN